MCVRDLQLKATLAALEADLEDLEESAGRRFVAGCLGVRPRGYSFSGT